MKCPVCNNKGILEGVSCGVCELLSDWPSQDAIVQAIDTLPAQQLAARARIEDLVRRHEILVSNRTTLLDSLPCIEYARFLPANADNSLLREADEFAKRVREAADLTFRCAEFNVLEQVFREFTTLLATTDALDNWNVRNLGLDVQTFCTVRNTYESHRDTMQSDYGIKPYPVVWKVRQSGWERRIAS